VELRERWEPDEAPGWSMESDEKAAVEYAFRGERE
jgi:hypothetical protein